MTLWATPPQYFVVSMALVAPSKYFSICSQKKVGKDIKFFDDSFLFLRPSFFLATCDRYPSIVNSGGERKGDLSSNLPLDGDLLQRLTRDLLRWLISLIWSWNAPETRLKWTFYRPRKSTKANSRENPAVIHGFHGQFEFCRAFHWQNSKWRQWTPVKSYSDFALKMNLK